MKRKVTFSDRKSYVTYKPLKSLRIIAKLDKRTNYRFLYLVSSIELRKNFADCEVQSAAYEISEAISKFNDLVGEGGKIIPQDICDTIYLDIANLKYYVSMLLNGSPMILECEEFLNKNEIHKSLNAEEYNAFSRKLYGLMHYRSIIHPYITVKTLA